MGGVNIYGVGGVGLVGVWDGAFFDFDGLAFGGIGLGGPRGTFDLVGGLGIASVVFGVGVLGGVLEVGLPRGWAFQ